MQPMWLRWIWLVPAGFLAVFLVLPLTRLVQQSFNADIIRNLLNAPTWQIVALAVVQATLSTALALAVGLPIANVVSRYRFHGRAFVQALVTVPFVLPTVVVALAFRALLGGGFEQGFVLVVLAHAYVNIAVVTRVVGARWAQHDPAYENAARTLGASRFTAFRTITLPKLRPAILSAAAVVFAFSFSSLGIALLLGDSTTRTLETQILRQTSILLDIPGATASALVQLVIVSVVLLSGAVASKSDRGNRTRPELLRSYSTTGRAAVRITAVLASAIVLAPVLAIVAASLRSGDHWSLAWWQSLGSVDAGTTRIGSPIDALRLSLGYALIAGFIAAMVGGLAAICVLARGPIRWMAALAVLPLGVSAATIGLGTLLAFGRPPWDLRDTGLLVPLAHALVAVPLVVAVVAPAVRAQDERLAQVAATLGAGASRAFFAAYGPALRLVMLAAGGLACAVSLGEFGAAAFLSRSSTPTITVQIVRLLSRPGELSYGVAAATAVILIALTLAIVLVVDRLGRRQIGAPA